MRDGLRARRLRWAGTVALTQDGPRRVLCVYVERRGTWELPKGGVRAGESALTAARRSCREETGLTAAACASAPRLVQRRGLFYATLVEEAPVAAEVPGHRPAWLDADDASVALRSDHCAVLKWAMELDAGAYRGP